KTWCTWKYGRYGTINDGELQGKLFEFCHREFVRIARETNIDKEEKKDHVRVRKVTNSLVRNVMTALSGLTYIPSDIEWNTWLPTREKKPWIAMQNGILDIDALLARKDDCLQPLSHNWFSQVILPYNFDPLATCP